MSYRLLARPRLKDSVMLASWPGIGNIGTVAIEHIRSQLDTKPLAVIEPYDYFYPLAVNIKDSIVEELIFPENRFYYTRSNNKDIIFFIADQQPSAPEEHYATGSKAYKMANEVMEVASRFGCRKIYTSGAALTMTHHTMPSKVWGISNFSHLIGEISSIPNTYLISEKKLYESNRLFIAGLNGILLGTAREYGIDAISLLGEIPVYLQALMLPYPRASKAVVEALCHSIGIKVDFTPLDFLIQSVESKVNELMSQFSSSLPLQLRKGIIDGLETLKQPEIEQASLTKEGVRKAIDEIENFFKKEQKNEE